MPAAPAFGNWRRTLTCEAVLPGPLMGSGWRSQPIQKKALVCLRFRWTAVIRFVCWTRLLTTPLWSPNGAFILYAEPLQGGTLSVKAIFPDKAAIQMPEIRVLYTTSIPLSL